MADESPMAPERVTTEEELRAVTIGALQPHNSTVLIVDYEPDWPRQFAVEAAKIRAALGERALQLEHSGSTSVPGLAAKPILDSCWSSRIPPMSRHMSPIWSALDMCCALASRSGSSTASSRALTPPSTCTCFRLAARRPSVCC